MSEQDNSTPRPQRAADGRAAGRRRDASTRNRSPGARQAAGRRVALPGSLGAFALLVASFAAAAGAGAAGGLSPCRLAGLAEEALCGQHFVAEDRAIAAGRRVRIDFAVVPARSRNARRQALFVFAGGPGQRATSYGPLVERAFGEVRRSHDIVLVDFRGTAADGPLSCEIGPDPLALGDPRQLAGEALRCLEQVTGDPRRYANADAVLDVEEVRALLAYPRIDLWGGSFGSRAALEYARRFPARVRSLVLDGAAPPELRFPLHNAEGAERALELLLRDCVADAGCAAAYPSLGHRVQSLLQRLEVPLRTVVADPLTGEARQIEVTRAGVASALRGFLYLPRHAALLPLVVSRASVGDFAPLVALSSETAAWSTRTMSLAVTFSVVCSEDVSRITDDEIGPATAGTFLGRTEIEVWRQICHGWPRGPLPDEDGSVLPLPALVLSGELDPVTPPVWGDRMAAHFDLPLHVVVPGAGHNTSAVGCVPGLIARFLAAGSGAGLDTSCVAAVRRPAFAVPFAPATRPLGGGAEIAAGAGGPFLEVRP